METLKFLLMWFLEHALRRPPTEAPQKPVESLPAPGAPTPPETPKRSPAGSVGAPEASLSDLQVFALTVWAEARGEPREGQLAVAHTILNRASRPRWWGKTVREVCLRPYQFSCWLPQDPQSKRLKDPATLDLDTYKRIEALCQDALAGRTLDPTGGADHYCTVAVAPKTAWAKHKKPLATIGNHNFYRLEK